MPINEKCLVRLTSIGLPMVVDVLNTQSNVLGQAKILENGKITYLKTNKTYEQPSALRQDVVAKNTATYRYLRYNGDLLSDLGVGP